MQHQTLFVLLFAKLGIEFGLFGEEESRGLLTANNIGAPFPFPRNSVFVFHNKSHQQVEGTEHGKPNAIACSKHGTEKVRKEIMYIYISHIRVISDYSTGRAESIFLSVAVTDEDIYIYILI